MLPVLLALLLALLAGLQMSSVGHSIDIVMRNAFLALDPPAAVPFWQNITWFGATVTIVAFSVLSIAVLATLRRWREAGELLIVMTGALALNGSLKWVIHRARPDELFPGTMPASYSFPSGHALFSFAFYVSLALILNRYVEPKGARVLLWIVAVSLVVLVGASRIFLGVHYPIDVLAGYVTGALLMSILAVARPPREARHSAPNSAHDD